MNLNVQYIKDTEGKNTSIKMPIKDWESIKEILNNSSISLKENIHFIETPIKIDKMKIQRKKKSFSDFLMDL